MCHSFKTDDSKQDSATNTAHINRFIALLKELKVLTTSLSTVLRITDGSASQYRCASVLYLISVLSQCYSIIIYLRISALRYGKEVVVGLNAVDKRYIFQFRSNFQLPFSNRFDFQMQISTGNQKR